MSTAFEVREVKGIRADSKVGEEGSVTAYQFTLNGYTRTCESIEECLFRAANELARLRYIKYAKSDKKRTSRPCVDVLMLQIAESLVGNLNGTEPHDTHVWILADSINEAAGDYTDSENLEWL